MLSHLQMVKRYISYYLTSKTLNSIHSPSIYRLIDETIEDTRAYYAFRELEGLRRHILRREEIIDVIDLGAGSKVSKTSKRKISAIAKSALSPPHKAQFLFKLCKHLQPKQILEFGTSLGLSALYMHKAASTARLQTIEGSAAIAQIAQSYFDAEAAPIELLNFPFDKALDLPSIKDSSYDLIYIDGNHTETATNRYVDALYKRLNDKGVMILDDIYWSQGMMNSWKKLSIDKRFAFSVDLFDYGLLIKDISHNQHESFKIIKRKQKPFSLGIWG